MADWLEPTIYLAPLAAWMFLGVGLPWALALLPRDEWSERMTVIGLGMALGPVGFTAIMFLLGTFDSITLTKTLAGSAILAGIGAGIVWVRRRDPDADIAPLRWDNDRRDSLTQVEIILIVGIVMVLAFNVLVTAYWPFLDYDPLWVFGYNAKIFTLQERISGDIGYYPQLVPLSYTYMQQAWGSLNDHAARAVIPWFNTTLVLMAYILGRRVFRSRRVGLLTAVVWAFYPHWMAKGGSGDLELTLTVYTTGAAAFFIDAWFTERVRPAVISGLLLAGALWTKPTGGALALGVMLAVGGYGALVRFRWADWWSKLRIAAITGAVSAPIGGMWYIRNLIEGHAAVTFPASYWHGFAQRSGQELGWPLLIAGMVAGGLAYRGMVYSQALLPAPSPSVYDRRFRLPRVGLWIRRAWTVRGQLILPGVALVLMLAGALLSAFDPDWITRPRDTWDWVRGDMSAPRSLGVIHLGLIGIGGALLIWLGRRAWREVSPQRRATILLIWALLLPYAVVWFWDFSYHYRLSFAIVPLFAVQVAVLIDGWVWDLLDTTMIGRFILIGIAGSLMIVAIMTGVEFTLRQFRTENLPDDAAKYDEGNPALMRVVHALEDWADEHADELDGRPPVILISGEDRLPFFFPNWDIRNSRNPADLPTSFEDLDGVDVFVNSSVLKFLLQQSGQWPNSLQADANVAETYAWADIRGPLGEPWPTVLEPIPLGDEGAIPFDDGDFRYEV
ncbi:MAG: glycosyltransferase family 39 protein, partial [Anaerolineae bacterium]|nr:glycosyltransferase family 39 protein [Anaerolineae bacterium]